MIDPVTKTIMETSGDYQYMRDDWTLPTELPSLQDAKIIAIDLETCDPRKIETRELTELAFLSTSQFERRFRAVFRMTPSRFLAEIRLRASARLLTSTDLTLAQVASRTGFFDQSHFGKAFRAEYGTTPKKYRAAYGKAARRETESGAKE